RVPARTPWACARARARARGRDSRGLVRPPAAGVRERARLLAPDADDAALLATPCALLRRPGDPGRRRRAVPPARPQPRLAHDVRRALGRLLRRLGLDGAPAAPAAPVAASVGARARADAARGRWAPRPPPRVAPQPAPARRRGAARARAARVPLLRRLVPVERRRRPEGHVHAHVDVGVGARLRLCARAASQPLAPRVPGALRARRVAVPLLLTRRR